ncbi:MAG: hypothetical protein M0P73_13035 [Syntrophobacterales bacterium]|nr:hypothetical protein [Syntrophobacterales bacterium]
MYKFKNLFIFIICLILSCCNLSDNKSPDQVVNEFVEKLKNGDQFGCRYYLGGPFFDIFWDKFDKMGAFEQHKFFQDICYSIFPNCMFGLGTDIQDKENYKIEIVKKEKFNFEDYETSYMTVLVHEYVSGRPYNSKQVIFVLKNIKNSWKIVAINETKFQNPLR